MSVDLESLLQQAQDLAPLPASAARLAALVAQPNVPLKSVVDVVALDPALTARLMRVANSAASGSRMPVKSARDAVVRLGNATVLALAVAGAVGRHLKVSVPEYGLSEDQLWRHSVGTALGVERIAAVCGCPAPPEAFTAGLLHDLGKLIIARFVPKPTFAKIFEARNAGRTYFQAEREVLGTDHADLAARLAARWGLPEKIGHGVRYHHTPDAPEAAGDLVADTVALANLLSRGLKGAPMPDFEGDHPGARARLGLDDAKWAKAGADLAERFDQVVHLFG